MLDLRRTAGAAGDAGGRAGDVLVDAPAETELVDVIVPADWRTATPDERTTDDGPVWIVRLDVPGGDLHALRGTSR